MNNDLWEVVTRMHAVNILVATRERTHETETVVKVDEVAKGAWKEGT